MIPTERISRFLSFLLRHRPPDYPLYFDAQGYAPWSDLIAIVQERFPEITEGEIQSVIEHSEKRRFELKGDKVRATYGHSFPVELGLECERPPPRLYHGTARDLVQAILQAGLKPRGRQYVHLSSSPEEALAVGKRRDPNPGILLIDSQAAHASGILFYPSGPLFLTKEVPPRFLSLWEE